MSKLSENLKLLRKEADLSLKELSEKTGINAILIEQFEQDKLEPNHYQLEVLCKVLRMPVDEIYDRDLTEERKAATLKMRSKNHRETYNWYFGNRKRFLFYLGYIAYFLLGISILALVYINKFQNFSIENLRIIWEEYRIDMSFSLFVIKYIQSIIRLGFCIFGLGVSVFLIFEYLSSHQFVFHWWYILWISIIISIMEIVGLVGSFPYFIYVVIRLVKKKY